MPDRRRHRGAHPKDATLFAETHLDALRRAVTELSWLWTRGYAPTASLKLVGDRHRLRERQRTAVMRCACADDALEGRSDRCLAPEALADRRLAVDGFNLLTTIEAALAGGVLLRGRDGALRDLTSMHGSYRRVDESLPALALIGESLAEQRAGATTWLFDRPVSNSGRVANVIEELAAERGWPWRCRLCADPDPVLRACEDVVVSADSVVLDGCGPWCSVAAHVVETRVPGAWVLDLG
jgi:hypothetical protein